VTRTVLLQRLRAVGQGLAETFVDQFNPPQFSPEAEERHVRPASGGIRVNRGQRVKPCLQVHRRLVATFGVVVRHHLGTVQAKGELLREQVRGWHQGQRDRIRCEERHAFLACSRIVAAPFPRGSVGVNTVFKLSQRATAFPFGKQRGVGYAVKRQHAFRVVCVMWSEFAVEVGAPTPCIAALVGDAGVVVTSGHGQGADTRGQVDLAHRSVAEIG